MNPETTCIIEEPLTKYEENSALKARIVRGDESAFAQISQRYSAPIYRFLVRMVGSSEDAKDLTQETFFAFYRYRQNFRVDMDLHPYLFTIARRKAISHLRWRKVRKLLTPLLPEHEHSMPSREKTAVASLDEKMTEEIVRESLAKLHPDKRAVILLRYFEGLSYSDIAKVMSKPEGTVKSMVYRGEQELRSRLAHQLDVWRGES